MEINRKSWHYRIAHNYGGLPRYPVSLCRYLTDFVWGLVVIAFVIFGVTILGAVLVDFVMWLGFTVYAGTLVPPRAPAITLVVILGFSSVLGLICVPAMYLNGIEIKLPEIVREAYRGWKDKYCPTVTFHG